HSNSELKEILRAIDGDVFAPYYSALMRLLIVFRVQNGRDQTFRDQRMGSERNVVDSAKRAQQNEGNNIPTYS
ncbi:hypothetical protein, partial [Shigella flexneri]|uniref:hypothetical protein n=1 Tax=Shigella flexneri TaxID=623 RepID=UPI00287B9B2B